MTETDDSPYIPTPSHNDPMLKSIFPTFDINVPMPADTAIPGSFNPPSPSTDNPAAPASTAEAPSLSDG
jgi:hypothetical protein